jgi:hypothetical protein
MKVDRCYILLGQFNRALQSGGSDFYNIDLRDIMGNIYDRYSRFCIKLESYHSRVANSGLPQNAGNEVQFLHIGGLPFINGYDTNPLYPSSRVVGVLHFEHSYGSETFFGMIYPSNIGNVMFSRQASSRISLELFCTIASSNTKEPVVFGSENPNFLFSITGIEDKYPMYRQPEVIENTSQLVLNTQNAIDLEPLGRALRFTVDLSQVIDKNVYNKYNKFVLTTKMVQYNIVYANFSAWFGASIMMSGLNWYSPSLKLNSTYQGTTTWLNLYHKGAVNSIYVADAGSFDYTKETFIDNVFYKPASPIVELSLTYNRVYNMDLIGVSRKPDPFLFIFNISPVDD